MPFNVSLVLDIFYNPTINLIPDLETFFLDSKGAGFLVVPKRDSTVRSLMNNVNLAVCATNLKHGTSFESTRLRHKTPSTRIGGETFKSPSPPSFLCRHTSSMEFISHGIIRTYIPDTIVKFTLFIHHRLHVLVIDLTVSLGQFIRIIKMVLDTRKSLLITTSLFHFLNMFHHIHTSNVGNGLGSTKSLTYIFDSLNSHF